MTLVEVRCKARGCGKLLAEVVSVPAEGDEIAWSGMANIPVCPRHGGARGSVANWVEKRRRLGLPHDRYNVGQWIYWADLRAKVLRARQTGRTQVHIV
jgi:hypothetical protein